MSEKKSKSKLSKKNILMLVRTCVIAAFALILTIVTALAWFITGAPKTDYLQVEVFGGIDAEVKLFWGEIPYMYLDMMLHREISDSAVVDVYNYTNREITGPSVPTYVPYTSANIAPGNGDCYKIEIKLLKNITSANMSVELIDIKWNQKLSTQQRNAMSGHILVNSFLQGTASKRNNIFIWDSAINNYKENVMFASNLMIGASANFYYYLYFGRDFPNDVFEDYLVSEPLFTIGHIKVTLR